MHSVLRLTHTPVVLCDYRAGPRGQAARVPDRLHGHARAPTSRASSMCVEAARSASAVWRSLGCAAHSYPEAHHPYAAAATPSHLVNSLLASHLLCVALRVHSVPAHSDCISNLDGHTSAVRTYMPQVLPLAHDRVIASVSNIGVAGGRGWPSRRYSSC